MRERRRRRALRCFIFCTHYEFTATHHSTILRNFSITVSQPPTLGPSFAILNPLPDQFTLSFHPSYIFLRKPKYCILTSNIVFLGTKYQSNLNEIDKGKQKTDEGGGKMQHNWAGGASQVTGELTYTS